MRFVPPILAALLLAAACSSSGDDAERLETAAAPDPAGAETPAPAKPAGPHISDADAAALRDEIYPQWLVPPAPRCDRPLAVRIDLAADGSVIRALAKPELDYDDPCRGAMDAAIRAVWAANPLNVPRTREWSSLTLVFDQSTQPQP